MDAKIEEKYEALQKARFLFQNGKITYNEAVVVAKEYMEVANEKAKEIAKRFKTSPKLIRDPRRLLS